MLDKNLTVLFLGAAYTQALSPTLSAQLVYDLTYQNGFLGNPYLSGPYGHENPPDTRLRHAIALRLAKYLPAAGVGFQAHGRLYFDQYPPGTGGPEPWHMAAGTAEARVYAMVRSDLEVRLAYRYHRQSRDLFWCPVMTDPACYHSPAFIDTFGRWSYDEKFGWLTTQYPELKLTWELEALEPVLRFLSRGAIEISYGYFVQSTHYRNAHVLQSGYSLPF
jgi:hypothetical protein